MAQVDDLKKSKIPSRRGRQIALQAIVGMVILICGVVIGWGAAVLNLKDKMMMPPGPRPPTNEVVEDMVQRYNLTTEQAKKVEDAFSKRRETIQTIFDEFRRKREAEFQKLSADIKKILTAEQYAHWEQDFQRRRRPKPPWDRGPGRPGERGQGPHPRRPGDKGPRPFDDRGPDRNFDNRSPGRDFGNRRPGKDFGDRDHGPREFPPPGPNTPEPNAPEPNAEM
jgi:Spy/CpxP family protein refolding chaperone